MKSSMFKSLSTSASDTGKGREEGFTLVETMVALVIMLIIGLACATLFVYSINNNSGANSRAGALAVAQMTSEKMRSASYSSLVAGSTTESVVTGGRTFSVVTTIADQDLLTAKTGAERKLITVKATPVGVKSEVGGTVTLVTIRASQTVGPNQKPNDPA
ncbi:MAG: type II secretion system GspH family protein [Pyrinomonadaceae bacterium MAG19_C2-C3]|nr:type II secretion system GspH family protein [Pyrinomonadaceae bacterium MAG19_C2-C3]